MNSVLLALLALACVGCLADASPPDDPEETTDVSPPDDRAAERRAMVDAQIASRGIRDPLVLAAMTSVPRHAFVPKELAREAYVDSALPIAARQTISQPYIVALMTEALELQPGEKVLEVGTGSGYQAAVLAEITDEVYSIEIIPELAEEARRALDDAGYESIRTRVGDGYAGWPEEAPFDAIIVTAAPDHVPPELVAQLAPGGRLCIPVGGQLRGQDLIVISRHADGTVEERSISAVRFVPMTGEAEDR